MEVSEASIRVPRFYLSTLLVLLLAGGGLLWLNLSSRSLGGNGDATEWGFPAAFYRWSFATAQGSASPLGIAADLAFYFVSLWIVGRLWERFVLRQTGR